MAQKAHFIIEQGVDFASQIELMSYYNNVFYDLSGATLYASMKKSWQSTVAYEMEAYVADAENGLFNIQMTWEQTSALEPGRYLYDIICATQAGERLRILEGVVTVTPGITGVPI